MVDRARTLELLAIFVVTGSLFGGEAQADRADLTRQDPRLVDPRGQSRYRVVRSANEAVEVPDVVTLKNGVKLEAYFLQVYGSWLVFYVKETDRSWLKEEVPRSEVTGIEFHQYLERDPVEPKVIERAKKQPVRKEDVLSGVFTAKEGSHSTWRLTFLSEIDAVRDFAEDSTDYGTVEFESRSLRKVGRTSEVRGEASYFLYAPNTVNNKDWVLVLSEIVHTEVERGRTVTLSTSSLPDETFILRFGPDRKTFELEWSNLGNWTWGALVDKRFQKTEEEGDERPFRPTGMERASILLAADERNASLEGRGAAVKSESRWGISGWKRPRSRLGR